MAAIVEQSREKDAESEPPQLSDYAQAALREFYAEREARQQELESRLAAGDSLGAVEVEEDWVRINKVIAECTLQYSTEC